MPLTQERLTAARNETPETDALTDAWKRHLVGTGRARAPCGWVDFARSLELRLRDALREVEEIAAHNFKIERERNECIAVVKGLDCYLHLMGPELVERIRSIIRQDEIAENERQRMAGFPVAALAEKGKA